MSDRASLFLYICISIVSRPRRLKSRQNWILLDDSTFERRKCR